MDGELRLRLSEGDADDDRLQALTAALRAEIRLLDVAAVRTVPSDAPPAGARGMDLAVAGGLLVSLGNAAGSLLAVVRVVQQWLARGRDSARTVRLELNGDVLELSGASVAEQARLVELFVDRHVNDTIGDA